LNDCVVFRLVSGEQCMATLVEISDEYITVENPIAVKIMPIATENGMIERTVTSPFCGITDDKEFEFHRNHIVYMKPLSAGISEFYQKLVNAFGSEQSTNTFNDEPEEDESFVVMPEDHMIH